MSQVASEDCIQMDKLLDPLFIHFCIYAPNGGMTKRKYDANGNMTSLTDRLAINRPGLTIPSDRHT